MDDDIEYYLGMSDEEIEDSKYWYEATRDEVTDYEAGLDLTNKD